MMAEDQREQQKFFPRFPAKRRRPVSAAHFSNRPL
jgi:hypothetical protein